MLYVIAANRRVVEDHYDRLGQALPDYRLVRDVVDAQGLRPNPATDTVLRLSMGEAFDEAFFYLTVHL